MLKNSSDLRKSGKNGTLIGTVTREEFSEEYREHYQRTVKWLQIRGSRSAEDHAQQTWLAAWKSLESFRGNSSFYSWVCAIGMNVVRESYRVAQRRPEVQEPSAGFNLIDRHAARAIENQIDAKRVLRLVNKGAQNLLTEKYILGRQYEEMARMLGCPGMSVRIKVMRSALRVRERAEACLR